MRWNWLKGVQTALIAVAAFLGAVYVGQTQGQFIVAQNGIPSSPSIRGFTDATNGLYFGTGFTGFTKKIANGCVDTACIPVLSTCGSAPSPILATGSNDMSGTYTTGGTATTCTITFGTAYTAAPTCIVGANGTATQPTYTVSNTAITVSVDIATTVYQYHCIAKSGG